MFNPNQLIKSYLSNRPDEVIASHRGSIHFDYVYAYTQQFQSPSEMVSTECMTETTALWITSYLAHWGMYRGSSRLGSLNIVYVKELLKKLLSSKGGILVPFFGVQFDKLHEVDKKTLTSVLKKIEESLRPVSPTATLVSKMTLGLINTIPGFDRNFNDGLKRLKSAGKFDGPLTFGANSLIALSEWYSSEDWPKIRCAANRRLTLPSARLIDMALFQYGVECQAKLIPIDFD